MKLYIYISAELFTTHSPIVVTKKTLINYPKHLVSDFDLLTYSFFTVNLMFIYVYTALIIKFYRLIL